MSIETKKQRSFPLIIPAFIGIVIILMGVSGFFWLEDIFYQVLNGLLIIPGILLLLYSIREFKNRGKKSLSIKHDERSEKNRLKASDLAFRFLFVSLSILILLNAMEIINETIFVALTGPIIAVGVTMYYIGYHWFEQRG